MAISEPENIPENGRRLIHEAWHKHQPPWVSFFPISLDVVTREHSHTYLLTLSDMLTNENLIEIVLPITQQMPSYLDAYLDSVMKTVNKRLELCCYDDYLRLAVKAFGGQDTEIHEASNGRVLLANLPPFKG